MTITDRWSEALPTNAPAAYRTPFLNQLGRRCELTATFDTLRGSRREWKVDPNAFKFQWRATRTVPFYDRLVNRGSIERSISHAKDPSSWVLSSRVRPADR